MSPGAPAAQLQWNLTAFCLSEAWITRTRDLPEGGVSSSLRTLSFAWPFTRRAVAAPDPAGTRSGKGCRSGNRNANQQGQKGEQRCRSPTRYPEFHLVSPSDLQDYVSASQPHRDAGHAG